jgi:serine/threonine-protein kinase HipA
MALRDLLNWTLFQILIGNSDAHGKNISFFVGKAGIDVAPSYDLLNIDIYGDEFEQDLALAVGDEFVAEQVKPYDLAEFCDASHLPLRQVATSLKNLCTATLGRLGSLPLDDVRSGEEMDFAQDLIEKLKGNAERFLAIAGDLPRVRL